MNEEIVSTKHPLIAYLKKLRTDPSFRIEEKRVLLEGKNCIFDVAKRYKPFRVISTKPIEIPAFEHILVSEHVFQKITGVEHPEGVLAEFMMPNLKVSNDMKKVLVLDRIQDPGNLGTIIRTAVAFGWDGIILIEGSCDPFNDKAMRSAKGATFDIAIQKGSWQDVALLCIDKKRPILVTAIDGMNIEDMKTTEKILLVLGNESSGVKIPPSFDHKNVTIPMQGAIQSLNVAQACGIFMYELARGVHGNA